MEAKEKALELYKKLYNTKTNNEIAEYENAKRCALICVDEVLNGGPIYPFNDRDDADNFYRDVKSEIEKL